MVSHLEASLVKEMEKAFGKDPKKSPDLGRIVHAASVDRIQAALSKSGGRTLYGGECDREARYVSPTIVTGCKLTDPIMQSETFGPVLCIIPVTDIDDAVRKHDAVSGRYPLAFYVFSNRKAVQEEMLGRIRSGGACVNDVMIQGAQRNLPFGEHSLTFNPRSVILHSVNSLSAPAISLRVPQVKCTAVSDG